MNTRVNNYYDLMTFGLGGQNFQSFVDKFQLKYNAPQTEGFVWDSEIQLDYTYEQLIAPVFLMNAIYQSYTTGKRVEVEKNNKELS